MVQTATKRLICAQDEDMGLSAEPFVSEVLRVERGEQDMLLLIASDGLWDVTDNRTALDIALRALRNGLRSATEAVLHHAQAQRSKDDITVMLLLVSSV